MKALALKIFDKMLVLACGIYLAWLMQLSLYLFDGLGFSDAMRWLILGG